MPRRKKNPTKKRKCEAQTETSLLVNLPLDLLTIKKDVDNITIPTSNISKFLNYNDIRSLRCTNTFFKSIYQNERIEEKDIIKKFLTHVVRGEKNEAEAMIKENPYLLLEKAIVQDNTGRKIYGTALRIALGAKDFSPYPDNFEEMGEMLERYLRLLPNGEEEIRKQYAEQFPEGYGENEEMRRQQDKKMLAEVIAEILLDKTKRLNKARTAVNNFKLYLENQIKDVVITTGHHFNDKLFYYALKTRHYFLSHLGDISSEKRKLVENELLGIIQSYFTANLAQAARDGFQKITNAACKLTRKKLLKDKTTQFFDPQLGVTHFILSSDHALSSAEIPAIMEHYKNNPPLPSFYSAMAMPTFDDCLEGIFTDMQKGYLELNSKKINNLNQRLERYLQTAPKETSSRLKKI